MSTLLYPWRLSSQETIIDSTEVGSSKRVVEAELDHEGFKRKKTNEASGSVQEQLEEDLSQEVLQQMMMVVLVKEVYVKALQVKYPIIDWEKDSVQQNLLMAKKEHYSPSGRGRRPGEGNDERVDDLNGQGNDQGLRANGGVEGVNGNA
ncbi:hypothetical protein Tco_0000327 [Tanacetum coccineum]